MPELQRVLAQAHPSPYSLTLTRFTQREELMGGVCGEFILIAVGVQGSKGKEGENLRDRYPFAKIAFVSL